ncbi:MAG: ion transporter [Paludibacteraceae bacterium]
MTLKEKWYIIIFESDTKKGKLFDVLLLVFIFASVVVVMLDSITAIRTGYKTLFTALEWFFTAVFTIEYLARIWCHPSPLKYVFSFWGVIDFLSIVPTYMSLFVSGYRYMMVVRIFRLLRVFRIFKMVRFSKESQILWSSIRAGLYKISIFFLTLIMIVVLMGTVMYVVEGEKNGFKSIPESIYWAIITITTVGYGDIVPHTTLGKFIASFSMIIGYSIIAIPTGIVTSEMSKERKKRWKYCPECETQNKNTANYCCHCGYQFSIKKIENAKKR